eukprot:TRINITY_DN59872_c0_g1_i1.p1 TRINITY_DN59872_c0_g1~~TRINITY_DN59872_c0_g1_i1.p1  ORF type:complete len:689 (-),score=57.93 TRINITY_DN59872_c0_g1_i1:141-1964(-)
MSIIQHGFHMPAHGGMFGRGIYFASDSSKSAMFSTSGEMLMCKVALGKYRVLDQADNSLTLHHIKSHGFDSVFAKPRSSRVGGVERDEYVVFDPDQCIPQYLIKFQWNTRNFHRLASLGISLVASYAVLWVCHHYLWKVETPIDWLILFMVISLKYFIEVVSLPQLVNSKGFLFLPILLISACLLSLAGIIVLRSATKIHILDHIRQHAVDIVATETSTPNLYSSTQLCFKDSHWSIGLHKAINPLDGFCLAPLLFNGAVSCSPAVSVIMLCSSVFEFKSYPSQLLPKCYKVHHLATNFPGTYDLEDDYALPTPSEDFGLLSNTLGGKYFQPDEGDVIWAMGEADADGEQNELQNDNNLATDQPEGETDIGDDGTDEVDPTVDVQTDVTDVADNNYDTAEQAGGSVSDDQTSMPQHKHTNSVGQQDNLASASTPPLLKLASLHRTLTAKLTTQADNLHWADCNVLPVLIDTAHDEEWLAREYQAVSWLPKLLMYLYLSFGLLFLIGSLAWSLGVSLYRRRLNARMISHFTTSAENGDGELLLQRSETSPTVAVNPATGCDGDASSSSPVALEEGSLPPAAPLPEEKQKEPEVQTGSLYPQLDIPAPP